MRTPDDSNRLPPAAAAQRAADEVAAFIRLFEERRAGERAGDARSDANRQEMERLAPVVQRHLEHLGTAWLHDPVVGGRPAAPVHVLAFGTAVDYEPIAEAALAQLAGAEASLRSGFSGLRDPRRRRRHRRGWLMRHTSTGTRRIGALALGALILYALILGECGVWSGSGF